MAEIRARVPNGYLLRGYVHKHNFTHTQRRFCTLCRAQRQSTAAATWVFCLWKIWASFRMFKLVCGKHFSVADFFLSSSRGCYYAKCWTFFLRQVCTSCCGLGGNSINCCGARFVCLAVTLCHPVGAGIFRDQPQIAPTRQHPSPKMQIIWFTSPSASSSAMPLFGRFRFGTFPTCRWHRHCFCWYLPCYFSSVCGPCWMAMTFIFSSIPAKKPRSNWLLTVAGTFHLFVRKCVLIHMLNPLERWYYSYIHICSGCLPWSSLLSQHQLPEFAAAPLCWLQSSDCSPVFSNPICS